MNRFHLLCFLIAGISTALPLQADQANLRRFAEYHISSQDLITFSSAGASIRLCTTCSATQLQADGDTHWYLFNDEISLQQATTYYVSKEYDVIFVGLDRQEGILKYLRFGGHPSDNLQPSDNIQSLNRLPFPGTRLADIAQVRVTL